MPYRPGVPTVLTVYDLIALLHPQTVSRRAALFFRFTHRLALAAADQVIAISAATRRDLLAHFRVAAGARDCHPAGSRTPLPPAVGGGYHRGPRPLRPAARLPLLFWHQQAAQKPGPAHRRLRRVGRVRAAVGHRRGLGPALSRNPANTPRRWATASACSVRSPTTTCSRYSAVAHSLSFPASTKAMACPSPRRWRVAHPSRAATPAVCPKSRATPHCFLTPPTCPPSPPRSAPPWTAPTLLADQRDRSLARAATLTWSATAAQTLAVYRAALRD